MTRHCRIKNGAEAILPTRDHRLEFGIWTNRNAWAKAREAADRIDALARAFAHPTH